MPGEVEIRSGAVRGGLAVLLLVAVLAGCAAESRPPEPPPVPAAPPAPPAACLLDTAALATTTGIGWTADETTASDDRCVYDPAGADGTPGGPEFLAVDIVPATGTAAGLETVAAVCAPGSRAPVEAGDGGFVCRFEGGSVFAARVSTGRLVTVAASGVPAGTTAARLVVALSRQLDLLGR